MSENIAAILPELWVAIGQTALMLAIGLALLRANSSRPGLLRKIEGQCFRQAGAIHPDKWAGPIAFQMNLSRNQFFAGSPFASNHHGQIGGRRFLDVGVKILHLTPTNQRPDVTIRHDRFSIACFQK